jgi:hypothetical protein
VGSAMAIYSGGAVAQDTIPDPDPQHRTQVGEGVPRDSTALPPPRSDHDPQPPVPAPTVPTTGVTKQAGVGGSQAYARAGVLELGGSGGFAAASNYSRFELSPSIGLFVVDNLELSLLTAFNYFSVGSINGAPSSHATELKALIEPSFHLPFSQVAFGFLGLGAGVGYITGADAGFALQPRMGANFLIGRSGVLTPSLTVAYSTTDAIRTAAGTILAVRTSYGMNIGYTVMW